MISGIEMNMYYFEICDIHFKRVFLINYLIFYCAYLKISTTFLAAKKDDAGFCPVIICPSLTTNGSKFSVFSKLPPNSFSRSSNEKGTVLSSLTVSSSLLVNPVTLLFFNIESPFLSIACNKPAGP